MPDPVTINRPYRRSVLSWLHLVRIYQRVVHAEQTLLAQYGLTSSQFDVLSHIATAPGLNQQALAGRLLVTKGNVAGLLDRLECAGLVKRQPDPDDRRSHRLYLTPAGAPPSRLPRLRSKRCWRSSLRRWTSATGRS